MKEHLPAGDEGKELTLADLSGTVQSPQFQQAVSMFSMALGSGQLGPVIKEFGLGDEAAAAAAQVRDTTVSLVTTDNDDIDIAGRHGSICEGSPEQGGWREER